MKTSRCLKTLALALCALAAFCLAACSENKRDSSQTRRTLKETMRQVVRARVDIPSRMKILMNMVELTEVSDFARLPKAATNLHQVVGKFALEPIKATEQIRTDQIARGSKTPGIIGAMPVGMRAITVCVKEPRDNLSTLRWGDHVDVVCRFKFTNNVPMEVTFTNLTAVHFDAGDSNLGERPIITVEATPEQCEILLQAGDCGTVQVSLPKDRKP